MVVTSGHFKFVVFFVYETSCSVGSVPQNVLGAGGVQLEMGDVSTPNLQEKLREMAHGCHQFFFVIFKDIIYTMFV